MAADIPTAARLQLGVRLRALRMEADVTGSLAGAAIRASHSKISRMESGHQAARAKDVRALARLYKAGDDQLEQLLELSRIAGQRSWWDPFSDYLAEHVRHHLSLEAAAEVVVIYDGLAVPPLLQIPAYSRALCQASMLTSAGTWRAGLPAAALVHRRSLMDQPGRPRIWALLSRQVLHRPPDRDLRVLLQQVEYLIAAAEETPPISIQLVHSAASAQLAAAGPFSVLRYAEPDLPDIVLLEHLASTAILERRADVDRYLELFQMIAVEASTPGESLQVMHEIKQTLAATADNAEGTQR